MEANSQGEVINPPKPKVIELCGTNLAIAAALAAAAADAGSASVRHTPAKVNIGASSEDSSLIISVIDVDGANRQIFCTKICATSMAFDGRT